jgi:hypothetical protein
VIEYALTPQCSLSLEFTGQGNEAFAFLLLAPSARPLCQGAIGLELSEKGARLLAHPIEGAATGLTPYRALQWSAGQAFRLKLQRNGDTLTAWVDGVQIGPVTITDPEQKKLLAEPQRFKLHGRQGGLYTIKDAVLVDGPEKA